MSSSQTASPNKPLNEPLVSPLTLFVISLSFYRSAFWILFGYVSWLFFPIMGYAALSFFPAENEFVTIAYIVLSLADLLLTFWVSVTLILVIQTLFEKKSVDQQEIQKQSISLLGPTARVIIWQTLGVLIGLFLFILPGIIALVRFAFAQIACVLDHKRDVEALKWSSEITKGRFFPVLYRLLFGPVLIGLIYSFVLGCILLLFGTDLPIGPPPPQESLPVWIDLLQSVLEIFLVPFLVIYLTLLYNQLKETRDEKTKND